MEIIDDILDISLIERGKVRIENQRINLKNIITDLMAMVSPMADEKNIAINLHYSDDTPKHFISDQTRVRQVILNIVNNAIKFSHEENQILSTTRF